MFGNLDSTWLDSLNYRKYRNGVSPLATSRRPHIEGGPEPKMTARRMACNMGHALLQTIKGGGHRRGKHFDWWPTLNSRILWCAQQNLIFQYLRDCVFFSVFIGKGLPPFPPLSGDPSWDFQKTPIWSPLLARPLYREKRPLFDEKP